MIKKMYNKNYLRSEAMQQRFDLSLVDAHTQSNAIVHALTQQFVWANFHCVHCYLPHLEKKEINIWPFIEYLFANQPQITIASNRINLDTNQIDCCLINAKTKYVQNRFGIKEPSHDSQLIDPQKIDLIIVPLLVCDTQGNRLGYGKGYYDRLLAQCRSDLLRIGVNYFPPLTTAIPNETHDIALSGLMTANQYFEFIM